MKPNKLTICAFIVAVVLCAIDTFEGAVTASPVAAAVFAVCLVCDLLQTRKALTDDGRAFIREVVNQALQSEVKPPG